MPEVVRLPVVQQRPHLSYSELMLFEEVCQWRWFRDYAEDRRSKTVGIDLSFGTAIHSTLEMYRSKDVKSRPTLQQAQSKFVRLLVREHMMLKKCAPNRYELLFAKGPWPVRQPYDLRRYVDAGKRILADIEKNELLREGHVIWNEFEVYEDIERLDGKKIKFKGFIDIAIRVKGKGKNPKSLLYICDFKTCSWGWGGDKRRDEKKHRQLFLYKHFVCKRFGIDPKDVRTTFILLKKSPPKLKDSQELQDAIELFTVYAGPRSVEKSIESMQRAITQMEAGAFVKNRASCIDGWGNVCPYLNSELCRPDGTLEDVFMARQEPPLDNVPSATLTSPTDV